ncbi:hypothetical protein ACROYT_G038023 [Oculina patagonica]
MQLGFLSSLPVPTVPTGLSLEGLRIDGVSDSSLFLEKQKSGRIFAIMPVPSEPNSVCLVTKNEEPAVQQAEQGYDELFDPPLESRYQCSLCHLGLREPVQTSCGHRFCRGCIESSMSCNPRDPKHTSLWPTATVLCGSEKNSLPNSVVEAAEFELSEMAALKVKRRSL